MSSKAHSAFKQKSSQAAFDVEVHSRVNTSIDNYEVAHEKGKEQFANLPLARERAAATRRKVVENMEKYLLEFEANFKRNGGKLIWANDGAEAISEILAVLKKHGVKSVVKSKSMVSEEIHLNEHLAKNNIESIETDLGEYIQQLAGEPPYHIVTPAMHKSTEDIQNLLQKKWNEPVEADEQSIATKAREKLRDKFTKAGAGITGANFLLADIGGISITENEGNAVLSASFPKIQIVVAGIERLLPSISDLPLFLNLLATYGTGSMITNYNTVITSPRKRNEVDGPEEMYVVLIDNGRTNLLGQVPQREALACIRCGACLNVCPVFKTIGGHAYGTTYSGPIGSVITPFLKNFEEYVHLSYASTLCGKCTDVCPVNIDLHKLLLYNRQKDKADNDSGKLSWYLWRKSSLSRSFMNKGSGGVKSILLSMAFGSSWGKHRNSPRFSGKSFNEEWLDKHPVKKN